MARNIIFQLRLFRGSSHREFHLEAFANAAYQLENLTHRCLISIVDE